MLIVASAYIALRRIFVFVKENIISYFTLSRMFTDTDNSNYSNDFIDTCDKCPYRHMVDRGYKPAIWVQTYPSILLILIQYILFIKGTVSKKDLIAFVLNDSLN